MRKKSNAVLKLFIMLFLVFFLCEYAIYYIVMLQVNIIKINDPNQITLTKI